MITEEWLELAEAAQIVGVHQSTLRRWADTGKIPHMRTLSGRRRFLRSALEQSRQEMHRSAAERQPEQLETRTLDLARQRTSQLSHQQANWFEQLNEEYRILFRYGGQRLLNLIMQFISRGDLAEKYLEEGRKIARDYGRICYRAGLTSAQTAEAFLYCRRSILESIQGTPGMGCPSEQNSQCIFLRVVDFLDALLVTTIESYTNIKQLEGAVTLDGEQFGTGHVVHQA